MKSEKSWKLLFKKKTIKLFLQKDFWFVRE